MTVLPEAGNGPAFVRRGNYISVKAIIFYTTARIGCYGCITSIFMIRLLFVKHFE